MEHDGVHKGGEDNDHLISLQRFKGNPQQKEICQGKGHRGDESRGI